MSYDSKTKINAKKTEFIVFSHKPKDPDPGSIHVFGQKVEQKSSVKYLGVVLDNSLNFEKHIEATINKVNKAVGALMPLLRKNSPMSKKNKILVYKMIIRPAILYAAPVWGGIITKKLVKKLQVLQNKCLRTATGLGMRTNLTTIKSTINSPNSNSFKFPKTTHPS